LADISQLAKFLLFLPAMNTKKRGRKFPMPVTRGSVTVMINRIRKPTGYVYYQIRYYADGVRTAKSCSARAEAEKQAAAIATKLHRGQGGVIRLRGSDRTAYLQAKAALGPIQVPLELAAHEYRLCHDLLAGRASVVEAVRHFAEAKIEQVTPKLVPEILKELLEVREKEGASKVHLKDIGNRLGKFAAKFTGSLSSISAIQIHDFLLALDVEPRTKNNFRTAISNLIGFAHQRRYVPRNYKPLAEVPAAKEIRKPVEIFTIEEMTKLLQHAKPTLVPFLCLVAFGGLRHEEAARLDWSDYTNGHIRVRAEIAKCREPRLVPVQPNLAAWLEPFRKPCGPVQPFVNVTNELADLAKTAEIAWRHNALRHAYGSFRLAVTQDPQRVSYEMGNSVRMVFRHYRALVTEEEGKRWFGIMPDIAPNGRCRSRPPHEPLSVVPIAAATQTAS
jgi:integrase